MNRIGAVLLSILSFATAHAAETAAFSRVELSSDGTALRVFRADGSSFVAPKFEDQDGFEAPSLSPDRRHVGWLALYPNRGASYSQPIELVVIDTENRSQHLAGDFGMIFQWCFTRDSRAVVYKYSFPHGLTSTGFDLRRLSDGLVLHRTVRSPKKPDANLPDQLQDLAPPAWAACLKAARTE